MGSTVEDRYLIIMFASQQGLWSHKFEQDGSGQWTDNWILTK